MAAIGGKSTINLGGDIPRNGTGKYFQMHLYMAGDWI